MSHEDYLTPDVMSLVAFPSGDTTAPPLGLIDPELLYISVIDPELVALSAIDPGLLAISPPRLASSRSRSPSPRIKSRCPIPKYRYKMKSSQLAENLFFTATSRHAYRFYPFAGPNYRKLVLQPHPLRGNPFHPPKRRRPDDKDDAQPSKRQK